MTRNRPYCGRSSEHGGFVAAEKFQKKVSALGGAARKVDQYAARKVIQSEGGSFYVLLSSKKEESACGNVGISRSSARFPSSCGNRSLISIRSVISTAARFFVLTSSALAIGG